MRAGGIVVAALIALSCTSTSPAACPTDGAEWEVAKLYIEHNATDGDTGVHGLLGGEAWRHLCLAAPDGSRILDVRPQGQLGALAVSDLFFESREPPDDAYGLEGLLADFPEGRYQVGGTDFDGIDRVGQARFTHAVPAAPVITTPPLVPDLDDAAPPVVPSDGLIVSWEPVTTALAGAAVEISGYEVIVTTEEFDDPDGLSRPIYDVHVGPDSTALPVPAGFLQPGALYELEVLALEVSGNQTITVGFFRAG